MSAPRTDRTLPRAQEGLPRLALTSCEAPLALGMSYDTFHRHIAPRLRWVRVGSKKLVSVRELEAFLEREAHLTLEEGE